MPELSVTDEQLRRLESVCADLEDVHVGKYGSVAPDDALEYLLDTYAPPTADGTDAAEASDDGAGPGEPESTPSGSDDGAEPAAELTAIDGVGEVTAAALVDAGFETLTSIEAADPEALTAAEGVGEKQAVDVVAAVAEMDVDEDGRGTNAGNGRGADSGSGTGGTGSGDPANDSPEDTLQQAMSLLDAHDDRWREGSGDEPYEVDLPDGETEAVRTKDDVKRLLFKHWK